MEQRQRGTGRLRPNIVLYGKESPKGDVVGELADQDLGTGPEIFFVLGTTLKMPGARRASHRALLCCKDSERIHHMDQQGRTIFWFETFSRPRIVRGLR